MMAPGYDVVGDIHGHADALLRLLEKLGYADTRGAFRHPTRRMLFLGDFIDRGPRQRDVVRIARAMCDAGSASAVMGNHEHNAIGWATPDGRGGHLRIHSEKNARQHQRFLAEFKEGSPDYDDVIGWFKTLPVWLERDGLRLVHACWHGASQSALAPFLDHQARFTQSGLLEGFARGGAAATAADVLLKGPEQALPTGIHFLDKDGHQRSEVRLNWWDEAATTFRRAALGMQGREHELPDAALPHDFRYRDSVPVCFGHYWFKGLPQITTPHAACLDFSVANGGHLTCYRWSGEARLVNENFVYVKA